MVLMCATLIQNNKAQSRVRQLCLKTSGIILTQYAGFPPACRGYVARRARQVQDFPDEPESHLTSYQLTLPASGAATAGCSREPGGIGVRRCNVRSTLRKDSSYLIFLGISDRGEGMHR